MMIAIFIEFCGLYKTFVAETLYLYSFCTRVPTKNYGNKYDIVVVDSPASSVLEGTVYLARGVGWQLGCTQRVA